MADAIPPEEVRMRRTLMTVLTCGVIAAFPALVLSQPQSNGEREALARQLRGAWLPLESGMSVSRSEGTPLSAKYEIEDGTFQLSVYTSSGEALSEVIVDESAGTIAKVHAIEHREDLAAALQQKDAMARATRTLEVATTEAVRANPGYRAVSAMPRLNDGRPVAEITLADGADWRVVLQPLD